MLELQLILFSILQTHTTKSKARQDVLSTLTQNDRFGVYQCKNILDLHGVLKRHYTHRMKRGYFIDYTSVTNHEVKNKMTDSNIYHS